MRETWSLANWKKHKLCLLSIPLQLHLLQRLSERTTSLQSVATDDNGTPATWTFGLVFQQAIDRQDRTQTEGRFSLLELLEPQPGIQEYSTGQGLIARRRDDMPCRTTPLRLLRLLQPERRDTISQPTSQDSFASRTPLTPVHPLTPTTSVLDTHVDTYPPIRWPNILNGIFPDVKCLPQRSIFS